MRMFGWVGDRLCQTRRMCLEITNSDVKPQVKRAVRLDNCSSQFNLSREFLLLCMGYLNTLNVSPPKVRGDDLVELNIFVRELSRILG